MKVTWGLSLKSLLNYLPIEISSSLYSALALVKTGSYKEKYRTLNQSRNIETVVAVAVVAAVVVVVVVVVVVEVVVVIVVAVAVAGSGSGSGSGSTNCIKVSVVLAFTHLLETIIIIKYLYCAVFNIKHYTLFTYYIYNITVTLKNTVKFLK